MLEALIKRLELLQPLSQPEEEALRGLRARRVSVPARSNIIWEGERVGSYWVVVEGLVCSYKLLAGGGRQILGLHVPGDVCGLPGLVFPMDYAVAALPDSRLAALGADLMDATIKDFPQIGGALRRLEAADAAIARQWMIGVGRRTAHARMAHLLCELAQRHARVGLISEGRFRLPMTQPDLADTLGMSIIHVNRTLQRLRSEGLIVLEKGVLQVLNIEALEAAAGFEPDYLYPVGDAAEQTPTIQWPFPAGVPNSQRGLNPDGPVAY